MKLNLQRMWEVLSTIILQVSEDNRMWSSNVSSACFIQQRHMITERDSQRPSRKGTLSVCNQISLHLLYVKIEAGEVSVVLRCENTLSLPQPLRGRDIWVNKVACYGKVRADGILDRNKLTSGPLCVSLHCFLASYISVTDERVVTGRFDTYFVPY
jgi:hypothetical protein